MTFEEMLKILGQSPQNQQVEAQKPANTGNTLNTQTTTKKEPKSTANNKDPWSVIGEWSKIGETKDPFWDSFVESTQQKPYVTQPLQTQPTAPTTPSFQTTPYATLEEAKQADLQQKRAARDETHSDFMSKLLKLFTLNKDSTPEAWEKGITEFKESKKAADAADDAFDKQGFGERQGHVIKGWWNQTLGNYGNAFASTREADAAKQAAFAKELEKRAKEQGIEYDYSKSPAAKQQEKAAEVTKERLAKADERIERANEELQTAKDGASVLGRLGIDLETGALDLAADAAASAIVPGLGLEMMATRVFGQAAKEQRDKGGDIQSQMLAGAKAAAIEVLTEKIGGPFEKVYGKTALGKFANKMLGALDTPGSRRAMKILLDALGEGAEEILSDLLNPTADWILGLSGNWDKESWNNAWSDTTVGNVLYDGLLGALLGAAGSTVEIIGKRGVVTKDDLQFIKEDAKKAGQTAAQQSAAKQETAKESDGDVPFTMNEEAAGEQRAREPIRTQERAQNTYTPQSGEFNQQTQQTASTNAQDNATINQQQTTADYTAAQQQEVRTDNGSQERNDQAPGRDGVQGDNGLGQSEGQGPAGQAASGARNGSGADGNQADSEPAKRRVSSSEKASRVYDSVKKASPNHESSVKSGLVERGKVLIDYSGFVEKASSANLTEEQADSLLADECAAAFYDFAAARGARGMNDFIGELVAAGVDQNSARQIAEELFNDAELNEYLEADEEEQTEQQNEPQTEQRRSNAFDEEEEAKPEPKPREGKFERSTDEQGRSVSTVTKEGLHYDNLVNKDTKTVRFANEKYKRKFGDIRRAVNKETGSKIIQRGVGDRYIIVNKNGFIEGSEFDDFGKAMARLNGKSGTYLMANVELADGTYVRFEDGQYVLDTDTMFGSKENYKEQARSMASDDLGVELNTYTNAAGTTDMFTFEAGDVDENGKQKSKFERKSALERSRAIICGERNADGSWNKLPGVTGKNGKHYVFAGQTAGQNKKTVFVMMEESAYNKFRKNMVGGLDPDAVERLNPAKYLANQGTYFSPSNADTGVKIKDSIVLSDVYYLLHNVTRRFLRTSDTGKDLEALVASGMTEEEAKKKLEQYKIGEMFLITGDLVTKATDGTGFINSGKGSFQFRSLGGFKGLLQSFDFVSWLYDNVQFGDESVATDDNGKITGGIRYVDKAKGIELLDKWGNWQSIDGKRAILFDSTVKFADQYTVKNEDGSVNAEKSYKSFLDAVGDADIRSIPKENVYGANPDSGMVEGYTRRGMAQLLRSQKSISLEDLAKVIGENVDDPISEIMSDVKKQALLFGVDLDSKKRPISSDIHAQLIWFFGEKYLKSNQGKKMVARKLQQIVEDARGGRLLFKNGKSAYQWVAPDPLGVFYAMGSLNHQLNERGEGRANIFENEGLKRGKIHAGNMAEGLTLIGRYPSMEETDVQLRTNVRNEIYDELISKYGLSPDITYFSLNDELSLNLDNDFDGDATMLVQGALAEAIRKTRTNMGVDEETGAKKGALFTEIVHGKADAKDIHDNMIICGAVRAALDGESIGTFDLYIDVLSSMPSKYLETFAAQRGLTTDEYRSLLMANLAAAYKFNVDYAKTGWYPPEYKAIVDSFMAELDQIAFANDFFIGNGKHKFRPVPASYEFSPNAKKREAFAKALAKQNELIAKKAKNWRTILPGGNNILTQLLNVESEYAPKRGVKDFYNFYADRIEKLNGGLDWFDLTEISTINPGAYTNLPGSFLESVYMAYDAIMRNQGDGSKGNKHRNRLLYQLQKTLGIDNEQMASLMAYVLSVDKAERKNYDTLLNLYQNNGEPSTKEVFERNIRILGNLATIGKNMNSLRQDMYDAIEHADDARKKVNDIKKARSEATTLVDDLLATIDSVANEYMWLDKLFARLKFSEETFRQRVSGTTVEALAGEAVAFEKYAERLKGYEERLKALGDTIDSSYAGSESAKERIKQLTSDLEESLHKYYQTVDNVNIALDMMNEDYNQWVKQFEREYTKREFYGIGMSEDTGLGYKDLDELTADVNLFTEDVKAANKAQSEKSRKEEKDSKKNGGQKTAPSPASGQSSDNAQNQQPVQKQEEQREYVHRGKTYNDRLHNIEQSEKSIANSMENDIDTAPARKLLGKNFELFATEVRDFLESFLRSTTAEDGGVAVKSFAEGLYRQTKNSPALKTLLGNEKDGNVAKAAERVLNAKNQQEFQNAVSDLSEMIAKEARELPKTMATIHHWKNVVKKASVLKFLSGGKAPNRLISALFGYQRDMVNILQGLDGFDRFANGYGYELAKKIYTSEYAAQSVLGNAMGHVISAQKAFEASGGHSKSVDFSFYKNKETETHTISLATAIDFLHTINTMEDSKLDTYTGVYYKLGDNDSMRITQKEQMSDVKAALEKAVLKDDAAKAYYDALTEAYGMFAKPLRDVVSKASGRTMGLFGEKYYPMVYGSLHGATDIHEADFGLDSTGFTQSRTNVEGGVVQITDPAIRFNAYSNTARNVLSRAEVGAEMERLDRGGAIESMSDVVEDKFGRGYVDEVKQFIDDTSNKRERMDEASAGLEKLRLKFQSGVLVGHLGAMLKQVASVFNSVGILDFDSVIHGIAADTFSRSARNRAENVGAIKTRHWGYIDPSIAETLNADTRFNKFLEKVKILKVIKEGFEIMDSKAIRSIYLACEYQAQSKDGLQPGQDGYDDAVMSYFVPSYMLTQPQWAKTMRPLVQTSSNQFVRMFGAFKTQPLRNLNTWIRSINEAKVAKEKYGADSTEFKECSKILRGVSLGAAVSTLTFGALGALSNVLQHKIKKFYDKDDDGQEEWSWTKFLERVLLNAGESFADTMIFGGDLFKIGVDIASGGETHEFWGVDEGALSTFWDIFSDLRDFGTNPSVTKARKLIGDIGTLHGIPLNNIYSWLNSAIMYGIGAAGENPGHYDDVLDFLAKRGAPTKERIDDYAEAQEGGIPKNEWYAAYNKHSALNKDKELTNSERANRFSLWLMTRSSLTEDQRTFLKEQLKFYNMAAADSKNLDFLVGHGFTQEQSEEILKSKESADKNGNGSLDSEEVYAWIMSLDYSRSQREALWDKFSPSSKPLAEYERKNKK